MIYTDENTELRAIISDLNQQAIGYVERISALEEANAKLQRVAIQTVFYLRESLEVNDGYELNEALRAAGYLGEGE